MDGGLKIMKNPYEQMDDLGGGSQYFWKHTYVNGNLRFAKCWFRSSAWMSRKGSDRINGDLIVGVISPTYKWGIFSVYPPPRMPVTNEGLGWDSLLKM